MSQPKKAVDAMKARAERSVEGYKTKAVKRVEAMKARAKRTTGSGR